MTNKNFDSQKNSYFLPIEAINGIKFTPREIDILACILGRRTAKKVASFLHISPKTVENHIRNIMQKLECNSRESIIDFIERAAEAPFLKQRYTQLLCQAAFEQSLKEISAQIKTHPIRCIIIDVSEERTYTPLIIQLKQNLKDSGIHTEIKVESGLASFDSLRKDIEAHSEECCLYVLSKALKKEIRIHPEFGQTLQKAVKTSNAALFCISNKKSGKTVIKSFPVKGPTNSAELLNYYYSFFEILKFLLPTRKLDEIFSKLKNQCEGKADSPGLDPTQQSIGLSHKETREPVSYPSNFFFILREWKFPLAFCLFVIIFFSAGFISFKNEHNTPEELLVRSELILPAKYAFLDRLELMREIEEKLKEKEGIQTIALVGLAGSGKKVLARHYARQQGSEIVWEVNAETRGTLMSSLESLAYMLSKSDADKQHLKIIQDIKQSQEREDRIFLFVRERIKNYPTWILIYYNVDDFSSIQRYFPQDFGWGNGKIIITTTDSNIQHNKYVNSIVQVGELNEKQRLDLFIKILNKGSATQLTSAQAKEIKAFLGQIPPFPLDVSVAAYYIKETKTPYDTYLQYLHGQGTDFNKLQENLLKEIGGYEQTRYNIVSLSLNKLISSHVDYKGLLLYLSLLNSKYIPRDLLYAYKDKLIVDSFLHDLNRYSLTIFTLYDSDQNIPTFSVHRSIQNNIFDYLTKNQQREENKNSLHVLNAAIENYITETIVREDFSRMRLVLNHCLRFVDQSQMITSGITSAIGVKIGAIYYYLGNFFKSKKFLEETLSRLYESSEKNYSAIAFGLARLGCLYRELGEYEQAKGPIEKSLVIYKQHLSDDHNGIAFALRHLARAHRNLGNYEKAKALIQESLQLYKNNLPANHIQVARSQACLGKIYKDLGNYSQAKEVLNQAYVICVKHYGLEHPKTARILRDLGQVYYLEGDLKKGEKLTQKALEIFQKSEHPEIYTVYENLAELHLKKLEHAKKELQTTQTHNFKEQAMRYLTQALAIVKASFPADSSHITRIQSKIVKLKEDQT